MVKSQKMKRQKSTLLFVLVILSLLSIGGIMLTSILKSKPQEAVKKEEKKDVLGEEISSKLSPTPVVDLSRFASETFQNTKEQAAQKVFEVQKTIVNTVEKEVSSLAQSQVDALKLQICRDWGVIPISPTKTP